jgi:hypothetical protein
MSYGYSWLVDVLWLCSPSLDLVVGGIPDGIMDGVNLRVRSSCNLCCRRVISIQGSDHERTHTDRWYDNPVEMEMIEVQS